MKADIANTVPRRAARDSTIGAGESEQRDAGREATAVQRLLAAVLTPDRRKLATQFLRFGTVGAIGFMWDWLTVHTMRGVIGLTEAMILAYFVAASMNWLMNRLWTFRGTGSAGSMLRQWGTFLAANSLGFLLNRGTALVLVHTVPLCRTYVVLALVAGTLAGMFANFTMSRRLVFR